MPKHRVNRPDDRAVVASDNLLRWRDLAGEFVAPVPIDQAIGGDTLHGVSI